MPRYRSALTPEPSIRTMGWKTFGALFLIGLGIASVVSLHAWYVQRTRPALVTPNPLPKLVHVGDCRLPEQLKEREQLLMIVSTDAGVLRVSSCTVVVSQGYALMEDKP